MAHELVQVLKSFEQLTKTISVEENATAPSMTPLEQYLHHTHAQKISL
jgi:hypothetical protein